jgi:uncharacterized membrane protein YdjX (TVP38/TMEM64 family)
MHRISNHRRWLTLVMLTLLLGVAWIAGRDLARHLSALENWITSHGWIGAVAFVGIVIVFTSMFVPDTVFAVIAGALFGVAGGTGLMVIGALCTAALAFTISRAFLQRTVRQALSRRPKLTAIHEAVGNEGLRFQLLLRLSPLHPVVVHYVLGASNTRFPTYIAACVGMIPTLAVEVYFGHAARHVADTMGDAAKHSTARTVLTLAGLAVAVAVLLYITWIARKTLATYESHPHEPGEQD